MQPAEFVVMLLQGLAHGAPFTDPPSLFMRQAHLPKVAFTAQQAQSAMLVQLVGSFLEAASPGEAAQPQEAADAADESQLQTVPQCGNNEEGGEHFGNGDSSHVVPMDVLSKWGHVMDIVTPDSCMTNCFTKTYTRFAKVCTVHVWLLEHCS